MGGKLNCLGCIKELNGRAGKNMMQNDKITEFQVNMSIEEEEFEKTTKAAFIYFEFQENLKRNQSTMLTPVKMVKNSENIRKKNVVVHYNSLHLEYIQAICQ